MLRKCACNTSQGKLSRAWAPEAELLLLNSRNNTHQCHDGQQQNGPQLELQYVLVVVSLNSAGNGSQKEDKDSVSAPAVVLPDSLGVVHASIQARGSPHGEANEILKKKDNGGDDSEVTVDGVEVRTVVSKLVVLNDGHASYEDQESREVEDGVHALTNSFLLSCVGRLQTQNRLGQCENGK